MVTQHEVSDPEEAERDGPHGTQGRAQRRSLLLGWPGTGSQGPSRVRRVYVG